MRFFKDMKFWKKVTLICGIPLLLISMLIGAMYPRQGYRPQQQ